MTAIARRYASLCLLVSAAASGCAADSDTTNNDDTSMSEAALSNSEQTAFNFFVSKGLTKIQAAGVVGNLMQESNVNPAAVEFGGGPGRGIAQWSVGGRWDTSHNDNATWYASAHGLSRSALNTQLAFLWYELTTFTGYGLSSLRAATTVTQAVTAFQDKYEICGTCDSSKRITYAQQALSAYGGSTGNNGAGCFSNTLGKEMPDNAASRARPTVSGTSAPMAPGSTAGPIPMRATAYIRCDAGLSRPAGGIAATAANAGTASTQPRAVTISSDLRRRRSIYPGSSTTT